MGTNSFFIINVNVLNPSYLTSVSILWWDSNSIGLIFFLVKYVFIHLFFIFIFFKFWVSDLGPWACQGCTFTTELYPDSVVIFLRVSLYTWDFEDYDLKSIVSWFLYFFKKSHWFNIYLHLLWRMCLFSHCDYLTLEQTCIIIIRVWVLFVTLRIRKHCGWNHTLMNVKVLD